MMTEQHDQIRAVIWQDDGLQLLDQRRLPQVETRLMPGTCRAVGDAIQDMVVRGAPAIGITAAYGAVIAARTRFTEQPAGWLQSFRADLDELAEARPTAVNLAWAIQRMWETARIIEGDPVPALLKQAVAIHEHDIQANYRMGRLGSAFLSSGDGVLTHCNTGSLATGGYGTALGVIRSAWSEGKKVDIFADETRPWLQGARLTAWELVRDGIPVSLIVDGAAAYLMNAGRVQWVIVGSDRIAANGDVANKIGTYSAAVAARHHGVKFMVVAPSSTIDMEIETGERIPIEMRAAAEVLEFAGRAVAAPGAAAWNPAFDVTPAELVDVLVTEKGVVEQPNARKMAALMM